MYVEQSVISNFDYSIHPFVSVSHNCFVFTGKKKAERKDLSRAVDEQALCVNSDAPRAYRSPIMARRKMRLMRKSPNSQYMKYIVTKNDKD